MAQQAKSYDLPKFKEQYENFIGGEWVAPKGGEYFDNISPVDGKPFTKVARSTAEDIELALDAAHQAAPTWNNSSAGNSALAGSSNFSGATVLSWSRPCCMT